MRRLFIILLVLMPVLAWAASEGPNSPTAWDEPGTPMWASPTYAYASDNAYTVYSYGEQHLLCLGTFGFSVSGTIDSIKVECEALGIDDDMILDIGLVKDFQANPPVVVGSYQTFTYGFEVESYQSYMFKETLTYSEVNADTFGVVIRKNASCYDSENDIDHVRITVYFTSTPPQALSYPKVTTWMSEEWHPSVTDSLYYGYINPDPTDSLEGRVTNRPKFSVMSPLANVDSMRVLVLDDSTGTDTVWYSGWVVTTDADSGVYTDRLEFADCDSGSVRHRLINGRYYYWKIQLKAATDTTEWSSWQYFMGTAPNIEWDADYGEFFTIDFDTSHSTLYQGTQLSVPITTGDALIMATNLPNDAEGDLCWFNNWIYVTWLGECSMDYYASSNEYSYYVKKYNTATGDTSASLEFGKWRGDNHNMPKIIVHPDTTIGIIIGGHGTGSPDAAYYRMDTYDADSGCFLINDTCFVGGMDTCTGGGNTFLIDADANWTVNELVGWKLNKDIIGAQEEERTIVSNTPESIYVSSAWSNNPTAGMEYEIYYEPPAMVGNTYPFWFNVGDSTYVFYRHSAKRGGTDPEDSSGTCSGAQTDSTLQDDTKNWETDYFRGWIVYNSTKNDTSYVISNTSTVLYVSPKWPIAPSASDLYYLHCNSLGFLSYSLFDPYEDTISNAWSDRYYITNFFDVLNFGVGIPFLNNWGASAYGSAYHNELADSNMVHVLVSMRDRYGLSTDRGQIYLRSKREDGLFKTWTQMDGDTVGYTLTHRGYRSDSTIYYGKCDKIATSTNDSAYANLVGVSNIPNRVVTDLYERPTVTWTGYADTLSGLDTGYQFIAQYDGGWVVDTLPIALVNFRTGGNLIFDADGYYNYRFVWPDTAGREQYFGAELYRDVGSGVYGQAGWTGGYFTQSSGSGVGRINMLPRVYSDGRRWGIYSRDNILTLFLDEALQENQRSWLNDMADIRMALASFADAGDTVTYLAENNRVPRISGKLINGEWLFALTSTDSILADSTSYRNRVFTVQRQNYKAVNPPVDIVGTVSSIFKLFQGAENFAPYAVPGAGAWSHGGTDDSVYVIDYTDGWFYNQKQGRNSFCLNKNSTLGYGLGSVTTAAWYDISCWIYLKTGGYAWMELWDNTGIYKRWGVHKHTVTQLAYDLNDGAGWVDFDTIGARYHKFSMILTDQIGNGRAGVLFYFDDVLMAADTIVDTLEAGTFDGTSTDSVLVDPGINWDEDEHNGRYVSIYDELGDPNEGEFRKILDTKDDTLWLEVAFDYDVGTNDNYFITADTAGLLISPDLDSLRMCTDSTTALAYFDKLTVHKSVEEPPTLTLSPVMIKKPGGRKKKLLID